jgi:hypothetical protein
MQHKAQLGHKTITKVTVVRPENEEDNEYVDPSLVFHVEDAPEPPPDEEVKPSLKVDRRDSGAVEVRRHGKRSFIRVHKL